MSPKRRIGTPEDEQEIPKVIPELDVPDEFRSVVPLDFLEKLNARDREVCKTMSQMEQKENFCFELMIKHHSYLMMLERRTARMETFTWFIRTRLGIASAFLLWILPSLVSKLPTLLNYLYGGKPIP